MTGAPFSEEFAPDQIYILHNWDLEFIQDW